MTDIIIGFDVEDYVNPVGANGIVRCANLLKANGVTGCFAVVGKMAEALEKWGRTDAIEAMKQHEISFHSAEHSKHPTITEYTDLEDYEAAKEEFYRRETIGMEKVRRILGVESFPAAVPPGLCTSYVGHCEYPNMGMPVYAGGFIVDRKRERVLDFCNAANVNYSFELDETLVNSTKEEVEKLLYELTDGKETCLIFHHPQRSYVREFWDEMNFKGENTPPEEWRMATERTPEEIENFYANFEFLIKKIKEDPNFRFVTYNDIIERYCNVERVIRLEDIPALKEQISEYFFPVTTPDSYCMTDILYACRDFLAGKTEHICGKVLGFLSTPYAVTKDVTVTADELRASVSQIGDGFLPIEIRVGDKVIGPADWLRAALEVLTGAEKVTVSPSPWQIDLDQFPRLRDTKYDNKGWIIHSAELKDEYLSDRLRLQAWTIRLPKGGPRKIFDEE